MPRTLALASGSERPTECQLEPRSSLTTIRPLAAAQMRCGRVASVAIVSTGAPAPPKPALRQVRPPSWLIIARPSITAARMSADPGIATSAVISLICGSSGHDRIGAAAVLACEQPAPAEQIETIVRWPGDQRPRRNRGLRGLGAQPTVPSRRNTPLAAAHIASSPSGEKATANTAPKMRSRASGTQLRPPLCELRIPRSVPASRWDELRGSTAMTSAALRNRPTSAFNQAAPRSRERNTPP